MSRRILLPARMDYAALESLHAEIKDARGGDLTLEAGAVTHLGSCGLQLLISAQKTWENDGHLLSLSAPSESFRDHAALLGYGDGFSDQTEVVP